MSTVFMWSYGSTNQTELTLGLFLKNLSLGGADIDVSMFLLNSLGLDPFL